MEIISQKSSNELLNNQDMNEDINEIGLPKSSLQSVVKDFLTKNKGIFILFDVDNFKKVNDTYGHVFGDSILCKFARIIENKVGVRDVEARIGGDEFAVFLKGDYTDDDVVITCYKSYAHPP